MPGLDFEEYAATFQQVAVSALRSGRCFQDIAGLVHLLTTAVERDLGRFSDSGERAKIACGPGCGTCCVLNVDVLPPEAITIAWYLRQRLNDEQQAKLCRSLEDLSLRTRWLDDEERLYLRATCAFLDDSGSCMIHQVRPLLCRSITSCDPTACQEAIEMAPLHGAGSIPMNCFQKSLLDAAYRGLAKALSDLGLDHHPIRLTSAVQRFLLDEGAVTSYLVGRPVLTH